MANELIKQLRDKKKRSEFGGLDGDDSNDDVVSGDDEYMSDNSPNKRSDRD